MSLIKMGLCPALSQQIFDILKENSFLKITDFLALDPEDMTQITGIPYKDVLAIRTVVVAQYACPAMPASLLFQDCMNTLAILPTGCDSLNELLEGGLYTTELTEIFCEAGVGKTQVCMNCALQVAIETEQNVIYIDTGGGFDASRLQDMLESREYSEDAMCAILDRILCVHAFDVFELLAKLEEISSEIKKDSNGDFYGRIKLIIIDSVTAVLSPILGGHQDGHGYMMHAARAMKNVAKDHTLAILMTNNTVQGDGGTKAALGKSWARVPSVRIALTRPDTSKHIRRRATLVKHTRQELKGDAWFDITSSGIESK